MKLIYLILSFTLLTTVLDAGPSSAFWTNCTTYVQPTGTANLQVYNYFTVFNRRGHGSFFAPDVGFLVGLFNWKNLSCETGIDYVGGTDDSFFFNGKVGIPEGKICEHAPSFSVGIFNVGTRTRENRTNQNIVDVFIGATLPKISGQLYVGGFSGSKAMGKVRQGYMISYARSFNHKKDCHGTEYDKWTLVADYASGKNTIGGGGFSLTYYFTPEIFIETGPVWFNDAHINGKWKWSVQIYYTLKLFNPEHMTWK
ncbi:MAG: hypothetical protein LLG04_15160 [Parachlamydia sp.]|nr:hypothetical protein [Parachlamydia sp.]